MKSDLKFTCRPELVRPGAMMMQQASPPSVATSVIRISPGPAHWRDSPPPPPPPVPLSVVVTSHNLLQQALTATDVSSLHILFVYSKDFVQYCGLQCL